jgi:uncharacterized protein (DUF1778 family)
MTRDESLFIRLTAKEKAALKLAAEHAQRTVSDWARLILARAAKEKKG